MTPRDLAEKIRNSPCMHSYPNCECIDALEEILRTHDDELIERCAKIADDATMWEEPSDLAKAIRQLKHAGRKDGGEK